MNYIYPISRILMALIFLLAGLSKLTNFDGTAAYMSAMGLPSFLLIPTIIFEVGGALAIMLGLKTRLVSLAFAGFCIISALVFHNNLGDQTQFVMFMKNIAMAGGFLMIFAHGSTCFSIDARMLASDKERIR